MTLDDYNNFCASLPSTTCVVQWGGASVWKIGGKVFAIYWSETGGVTFKAGDIGFEVLKEEEGYKPAPYFASRGMKWILASSDIDESDVIGHIENSYKIVKSGLSKKLRIELGG